MAEITRTGARRCRSARKRLRAGDRPGDCCACSPWKSAGLATAQVVKAYDGLGRQTSYTDADGAISTTTYDLLGRDPRSVYRRQGHPHLHLRRWHRTAGPGHLGHRHAGRNLLGQLRRRRHPDLGDVAERGAGQPPMNQRDRHPGRSDLHRNRVARRRRTAPSTPSRSSSRRTASGERGPPARPGRATPTRDQAGRLSSITGDYPIGGQCTTRSYGFSTSSNRILLDQRLRLRRRRRVPDERPRREREPGHTTPPTG